MHWLTSKITALQVGYDAWKSLRKQAEEGGTEPAEAARARITFLTALAGLVEEVASRGGVDAAFASHDGLLVHCVGNRRHADALAAVAASVVQPAYQAADNLSLGDLQQVVFAGTERKLALVVVGEISIGVLAPVEVQLARVLAS